MFPENETLRQVLDSVHDGIYMVDRHRKITYWNKGAERLTGFRSSEAVGTTCSELLMHIDRSGRSLCNEACFTVETMADERPREMMLYVLHKEGYRLPVATRVIPSRDAEGKVEGAAVIFGDVTSMFVQVKRLEELQKIIRRDPPAELESKREIEISLHVRVDEMQRYNWPFGVLFFDIDRMAEINEQYGAYKGNRVLRVVAMTLLGGIRSTDVVGRWSGNEFITIVGDVNEHQLYAVAGRTRMLVEKSMIKDEHGELSTTLSIGATLAKSKDTVYTLLKRAEDLMRKSAKDGFNRVTIDADV